MNDLVPYVPQLVDLALPAIERVEFFRDFCRHSAEALISREENEDAPWMPQAEDSPVDMARKNKLREQEVDRREMQVITHTGQIANLAEMSWALEHRDDIWTGEDAGTFQAELESLMPGVEQRASSGRARQVASFITGTLKVFGEHGIPERDGLRCYAQGKPTFLGDVATAQREISKSDPDTESRKRKFEEMINVAEVAPSAYALRRELARIIGNGETSEEIFYSIENDGEQVWVIMHMDRDLFVYRVLDKLREILVPSLESLAERFSQFWKAQQG